MGVRNPKLVNYLPNKSSFDFKRVVYGLSLALSDKNTNVISITSFIKEKL